MLKAVIVHIYTALFLGLVTISMYNVHATPFRASLILFNIYFEICMLYTCEA
jgi:hypothetical protein